MKSRIEKIDLELIKNLLYAWELLSKLFTLRYSVPDLTIHKNIRPVGTA